MSDRFKLFPIKYPTIWKECEKAEASLWTTGEIDLSKERTHWKELPQKTRDVILRILAFFATADGIVNENIVLNFYTVFKVPEIRQFYALQMGIEAIHVKTYSMLIDHYVPDLVAQKKIFDAIDNIETVKSKGDWSLKWMGNNAPLTAQLIAYACVEQIFFSSSFCIIYWVADMGILPGLTDSNKVISRDEALHGDFSILLHHFTVAAEKAGKLAEILTINPGKCQLSPETMRAIVKDAVKIEKEFAIATIPENLKGMNAALMCEHIESCGDRVIESLGLSLEWNTQTPFDFMEKSGAQPKSDFFCKKVFEYNRTDDSKKSYDTIDEF